MARPATDLPLSWVLQLLIYSVRSISPGVQKQRFHNNLLRVGSVDNQSHIVSVQLGEHSLSGSRDSVLGLLKGGSVASHLGAISGSISQKGHCYLPVHLVGARLRWNEEILQNISSQLMWSRFCWTGGCSVDLLASADVKVQQLQLRKNKCRGT